MTGGLQICSPVRLDFKLKVSQVVPLISRFLATVALQSFAWRLTVLTILRKVRRCYLKAFELAVTAD